MNYSEQVTEYMVNQYSNEPTRDTVEKLAEELDKSIKSVIGKLSREGVYRREIYRTKSGETPVTKVEIVSNIAESLGLEVDNLLGLDKAPKNTLKALEKGITSNE
jgi:Zn-dependent M32 family carboxypeptidase|tara:strand:- start:399 stop:713 length:315 start_codon:yes stop_codon:yes gene_type:complete